MNFKTQKKMMQYQLLDLALKEEGLTNYTININHKTGFNTVNDIEVYLKYPRSYIEKISKLDVTPKYNYVFKGGLTFNNSSINRSEILSEYMQQQDSLIIGTSVGIEQKDKTEFDTEYYQLLCNSNFSLCPNWSGEQWDHEHAWTYRFIESCFSKSIPIIFRIQPLGKVFTKDIFFYWNDELHLTNNYNDIVENNYKKALTYWTLQPEEINAIRNKQNV